MADFCHHCSIDTFGEDFGDLANLLPQDKYSEGMGAVALCECCGPIVVDIDGNRISDFDEHCHCADRQRGTTT